MHKTKKMDAGKWMIPVSSTAPASGQPILPSPPMNNGVPFQQPMGGSLDPLSSTILSLNTNPYIIGIFMLLLNLGGRFLPLELTKKQEAFLQSAWLRPLLFFTVIYISTRNLVAALWVTLLFFFIIWVVANEHSPYCLIPSWCGENNETPKQTYAQNLEKLIAV